MAITKVEGQHFLYLGYVRAAADDVTALRRELDQQACGPVTAAHVVVDASACIALSAVELHILLEAARVRMGSPQTLHLIVGAATFEKLSAVKELRSPQIVLYPTQADFVARFAKSIPSADKAGPIGKATPGRRHSWPSSRGEI